MTDGSWFWLGWTAGAVMALLLAILLALLIRWATDGTGGGPIE